MVLLLAALTAFAGAPDAERQTLSVSNAALTGGSVSGDGSLYVFVSDGNAELVDISDWTQTTISDCIVQGATIATIEGANQVWVGCSNGTVIPFSYEDGRLEQLSETIDDEVQFISLDVVEGSVQALHWSERYNNVYAVVERTEGGSFQVVILDVEELSVGATSTLAYADFSTSTIGNDYLFIAHGDARMSTMALASGSTFINTQGLVIDVDQMAATSRDTAWTADFATGQIADYQPGSQAYGGTAIPLDSDLQGIGVSADTDDEYGLVARSLQVDIYGMSGGAVSGSEAAWTIDVSQPCTELVVGPYGYVLAGTDSGSVLVLSANPWIGDVVLSSDIVTEGDTIEVSFSTDQVGDYELVLGGDWRGGGEVVGSGTITEVGTVNADVSVTGWTEGDERLWIRVTNENGAVGHNSQTVTVDSAPEAVALDATSIGFGDELLIVTFQALEATDISTYRVYVTTEPFEAVDHPTGGPDYVGDDELVTPIEIAHIDGEALSVSLAPVTNETIYYIAVRATDNGGLEGPMSDVVEGRPRPTKSAGQLAGEVGGPDCSSVGAPLGWTLALAGLGLGLVRRRKTSLVAGALLGLGGLSMAPVEAVAGDNGDMTPAWGHVEVRYGVVNFEDSAIKGVHGDNGNGILLIEAGPQLYRFLEIDLGTGIYTKTSPQVSDDGEVGTLETRLRYIPFTVGATLRLHLLDEQFIVPFGGFGFDWAFYSEKTDTAESADKLNGIKRGYHWAVGASLLLDTFDRRRASLLEAQSNINDSWLSFEYRQQKIDGEQGLTFTGNTYTLGLKLDF